MRSLGLPVMPGVVGLALLALAAPAAHGQRMYRLGVSPMRPPTMSNSTFVPNSMSMMNSMMLSPRLFNPPLLSMQYRSAYMYASGGYGMYRNLYGGYGSYTGMYGATGSYGSNGPSYGSGGGYQSASGGYSSYMSPIDSSRVDQSKQEATQPSALEVIMAKERSAQAALRGAALFQGKPDTQIEIYRELIKTYPDTEAAKKANALLENMPAR